MKRYLLFRWYAYEASGGWNDLVDSFDTIEEAIKVSTWNYSLYQIVDIEERKIVKEFFNP